MASSLSDAERGGGRYEGLTVLPALSPRFPCSNMIRSLRHVRRPGIQILWGTFGSDPTCVRRFMRRFADRPHLVEVHPTNESCRRFRRCGDGELFRRLSPRAYDELLRSGDPVPGLEARIARIRAAVEPGANANTRLAISLGLEHDFGEAAARELYRQVRRLWPHAVVFNRNGNHRTRLRVDATEIHAPDPSCRPGDYVSADGFELGARAAVEFSRRARERRCGAVFLFRGRWSGRFGRTFVAPRKRRFLFGSEDVRYVRQSLR